MLSSVSPKQGYPAKPTKSKPKFSRAGSPSDRDGSVAKADQEGAKDEKTFSAKGKNKQSVAIKAQGIDG